jgi:hypothetical protein
MRARLLVRRLAICMTVPMVVGMLLAYPHAVGAQEPAYTLSIRNHAAEFRPAWPGTVGSGKYRFRTGSSLSNCVRP